MDVLCIVRAPLVQPRQEKALRLEVKIRGRKATVDSRLLPGDCLILRRHELTWAQRVTNLSQADWDFQAINPGEQGVSSYVATTCCRIGQSSGSIRLPPSIAQK
jgi:hypothetical protein